MQWGDGFEIETLINCRVAVAKLNVAEVPSIELQRVFGESNLHAVKDGLRVLKTLITERIRAWRGQHPVPATQLMPVARPAFGASTNHHQANHHQANHYEAPRRSPIMMPDEASA